MSTTLAKPDLRRLVETINYQATGYSPCICDRLQQVCLAIGDQEQEYSDLRKTLSLSPHQLKDAVLAGSQLGVLICKRQNSKGRARPSRVSLSLVALKSLATTHKPPSATDVGSLARERRARLGSISWQKTGLGSPERVRNVALVCTAIGNVRQVSQFDLHHELGLNPDAVWKAIRDGRKIGVLEVELKDARGGRRPSVLRVNWDGFATYRAMPGEERLDLTYRPMAFYDRQPKKNRCNRAQRQLLDAADSHWKKLGFRKITEWLCVKNLITTLGECRQVGILDLAAEFGASSNKIKEVARAARRAGVVSVKRRYDLGRKGSKNEWRIDFDRIEDAVGKQPKAATAKGKPNAVETRGQKRSRRDLTCDWLQRCALEHPGWSLSQRVRAYNNAHYAEGARPLTVGAAEKAIARRRRGMLKPR